MASYTGTIRNFVRGPSAFAFTVEWPNPDPPPAMLSHTFTAAPTWVAESVTPNIGKTITVTTDGGTPEAITSVTVSA